MSTAEISIFTEQGFAVTFKIAEAMVKSGILPRGIDNPFKAFAIIQKGREMGVEPMRALTGIYLIEGKTVVSPELKLECFKSRGGKVEWDKAVDQNKVARATLTAPDGTTHVEEFTLEDAAKAGLTSKDNWRKYTKSMLRARCVAFGLRALGEGDGSYTPDELGAVTNENGMPAEYTPPARESVRPLERSTRTASAPAQPAGSTIASPSATVEPAPASRKRTAADVAPTGGPCTPDQNKLIHVLKSEVGGVFSGDGSDPRDKWSKTLGVYRTEAGERCQHTNELSKDQATHLIDRMQGYVEKQGQRAANVPDIGAALPESTPTIPALLNTHFDDSGEASDWINGLFGVRRLEELDGIESETALQLLLALGTDGYDAMEAKCRAMGKIR